MTIVAPNTHMNRIEGGIRMRTMHVSRVFIMFLVAALGVVSAAAAATSTEGSKEEKILDKVSKEGFAAIQEVRHARVAIFDGQPQEAEDLLGQAKKNLSAVEKNAPAITVTVKAVEKVGGKTIDTKTTSETTELIPIDAGLVLSEDFVATPEKTAKIQEANKHLKKGDKTKAVESLRETDIAVSVSRVLMPLKSTVNSVDKAISLLKEEKYYEANLALKGVEDGLIVDTVLLSQPEPPAKAEKK
ncbi:conserved exported hypothetical protein [uncultured Desulfobacterium sp.]|uniref:YfdX family protein n=1 Tax=uncultured Desulfobacterium sp. TaxID=201089 RepID=A0A445N3V7_9BACT|nr:conserved exported hypothetical protein [uncultured Desulfobacterium sp.]